MEEIQGYFEITLFFRTVQLFTRHPKAPFPGLVVGDRLHKFCTIEIWPERFGEIQFRIGNLPEQEI
jgi:hypothetical protein